MDYPNRLVILDLPLQVTCQETVPPHPESIDLPTRGTIVPFCRGEQGTATSSCNTSGISTSVIIFGGGTSGFENITLSDASGTPYYTQSDTGYSYSFIMPYDGILRAIYMTSINYDAWTLGTTQITPYVALFTAPAGSLTFTIIPETKTTTSTNFTGTLNTSEAVSGYKNDLNVPIPAGTRVAIIGGFNSSASARTHYLEFAGSLYFSANPIQ